VAVDAAGNVYFTDTRKQVVCRMQPSGRISIIAGKLETAGSSDGAGSQARFCYPRGIAVDAANNVLVADSGNNIIRRITPDGVVTTIAGLAGTAGSADGTGENARFNFPVGVAVDHLGNIFVADLYNGTIRKVTSNGVVTTIAGQAGVIDSADGTRSSALFDLPIGVAVDDSDNVYVADWMKNVIRKITTTGLVTTFAGGMSYTAGNADGAGNAARFFHPSGIVLDRSGNIYVADSDNFTIRRIGQDGTVTTLAGLAGHPGFVDGTGSAVRFWHTPALALDKLGNLYVADFENAAIRKGSAAVSKSTNTALPLQTSGANTSYRK
jgi:sugar lactone lactonase YvrE